MHTMPRVLLVGVLLLCGAALGCQSREAQAPAPAAPPASAPPAPPMIASFDECAAAGHPIAESYPRQCQVPGGRSFTEDVGNRVAKQGLIQVDEPTPNQVISSPLTIHGKARGPWFFEASFPVELIDSSGAKLATGIIQADGEWMTEDFVPFRVTLTFTVPPDMRRGKLVFSKSNASGLPEHDDQLVVPVKFKG
jgi:hypothetical protein